MPISRILQALAIAGALLLAPCSLSAQDKGMLAQATIIKGTFSLVSVGTWGNPQPTAVVKPVNLVLQFDGIKADEGTAQLQSNVGQYDIIVRYAEGYLHFIQSFLDGPLYTTTILEKR